MSNKISNSKVFHYVCFATMYGAQSKLLTSIMIVLFIVIGALVKSQIPNDMAANLIVQTFGVFIGIRFVFLAIPEIRKDVCKKMNWVYR
ncbi:hypothetical protein [Vibrio parahaemolyticus]|uniref:hypothetical protein n=1 Tax=Vibrio parahaemolyticus TaxID=670 RepID=UPI001E44F54A|nr:hypothetical protein [Vibrio parahaemolyticus]